jgi:Ser/Thr protein kinase RdoA (MazF antagonist)
MLNQTILAVLKNYSVGELVTFAVIIGGVSDQNYQVRTSQGVYFLKKHLISFY